MSWNIRVDHEVLDEGVRLTIEVAGDVPEDVIGSVAGSYWEDEVRYAEEWEEDEEFPGDLPGPPGGLHG